MCESWELATKSSGKDICLACSQRGLDHRQPDSCLSTARSDPWIRVRRKPRAPVDIALWPPLFFLNKAKYNMLYVVRVLQMATVIGARDFFPTELSWHWERVCPGFPVKGSRCYGDGFNVETMHAWKEDEHFCKSWYFDRNIKKKVLRFSSQ